MPSRQQLKQLQLALINAFPSRALLERLLYFELEKNLNEITRESDLQDIVFNIIQIAEAQGWLDKLVRAARKENPGNSELKAIAEELFSVFERKQTGDETPQTPGLNIPQKPNNQQQKILVVSATVIVVFVLIAEGTRLLVFNQGTDPIASSSPTISTNPSKPEQSTSVQSDDDLSSQKGVDYTRLRDLLKAGNWKQADDETYSVMLKVVGRKDGDFVRDEELLNFPCTDLRTIDRLWVKYSSGRFGFSVQKEIYLSVGGKPDGKYYEEAWNKFGDRVGWRVNQYWIGYSSVTFNTTDPEGHLPAKVVLKKVAANGLFIWLGDVPSLARMLVNCSL